MGLILWVFLTFGLTMGGLAAFFYSEHKEGGIIACVSGVILLVLPTLSMGSLGEGAGFLVFLGSYFFLAPAWKAYQTYQDHKRRMFRAILAGETISDEETAAKEKAFNRLCIFLCLFGLGLVLGMALLFQALAI